MKWQSATLAVRCAVRMHKTQQSRIYKHTFSSTLDETAVLKGNLTQVLQQTTEYDALQWAAAVKQYYKEERSLIAAAADQATRASAERAGIGQWLSGMVLREGKVGSALL